MTKSSNVKTLNSDNFDETIQTGVTLVDFWATWCPPCRALAPILEKVAAHLAGKVNICKLDVDQNEELAMKYAVSAVPTLIIFKDGKIAKTLVGLQQESTLVSALEALM